MLRQGLVLAVVIQVIAGYALRSSDQGWDETQVKRSKTWPVPPWEDDRYKDCFTDGMLDPTKCPYLMKRSKTWPVPPEDDPKYEDCFTDGLLDPTKCPYLMKRSNPWPSLPSWLDDLNEDCFTDGMLDPTKCPYKRSSDQGWDETKTYGDWEDWDPELANEISSDQGWDETQVKRSDWEDWDPELANEIRFRGRRSSDQGWDETKTYGDWEDWDPELANEISSDQGWDETQVKRSDWEDWDPELANEITGGDMDDLDNEISLGREEPPYRPYPEDQKRSSDQGWDETQVKRSKTWPVPPWEDDRYKDCFTDGMLDPTKCPYLLKRSKTWPVPPEDDPKYEDCFTDGMLDPTKCPYKRSSDQGWDETKTYGDWEDWDPELANEISSDQGWDETQVKRSDWEDWDPELANEIRFRGQLDQHKPNPLEPEVEPNLQFPDGPAKRFLKFPPGHGRPGDWNGPQVEPPTNPDLERSKPNPLEPEVEPNLQFPDGPVKAKRFLKFPPGQGRPGDWNGPQVEPPTNPELERSKPNPLEPEVEPNLQFPEGPAR